MFEEDYPPVPHIKEPRGVLSKKEKQIVLVALEYLEAHCHDHEIEQVLHRSRLKIIKYV